MFLICVIIAIFLLAFCVGEVIDFFFGKTMTVGQRARADLELEKEA